MPLNSFFFFLVNATKLNFWIFSPFNQFTTDNMNTWKYITMEPLCECFSATHCCMSFYSTIAAKNRLGVSHHWIKQILCVLACKKHWSHAFASRRIRVAGFSMYSNTSTGVELQRSGLKVKGSPVHFFLKVCVSLHLLLQTGVHRFLMLG